MKRILLILVSVLMSISVFPQALSDETSGSMSLLAINVRKADALLLRCGNSAYLIDTGAKKDAETMLNVLRSEGIARLTGDGLHRHLPVCRG